MFLVNSHPGLFTVTPFCILEQVQNTYQGHPFFRSYGVSLPSSLTRVHPSTFGYSPHLPVSVCGTVTQKTRLEVFLGSVDAASSVQKDSPSPLGVKGVPDLPRTPAYGLESRIPTRDWPTLLRPPITQMLTRWYRNINLFPIAYAFQPQLRGRLTLSGLTFLRKP